MRDPVQALAAISSLALLAGCRFEVPVILPPPVIQTTASGVSYVDLLPGEGPPVAAGDRVEVHYVGRVDGGEIFDESRDRGEPLIFVLGTGLVLPAWEEGLEGMRAGGVRELTIPPELAYGDEGQGELIPPGATLILEVELIAVELATPETSHP